MKTLLSLLLIIACVSAKGQGAIELTLSVVGLDNKPRPGLSIKAVETTTLQSVTGKTNTSGQIVMQLDNGREWDISVGEIQKCIHVVAMPNRAVRSRQFFVYDPKDFKRKQQQDHNRTNEKFKVVTQATAENAHFKKGECYLALKVQQPEGRGLRDIPVDLVNVRDSIIYTSKTNERGMVFFILPNKTNYEIDVNHVKNFSYIDFGDEYRMHSLILVFAPTNVKEKIIRDTVYQELDATTQASSERTLVKLSISGGKKDGVNEKVYLRAISSGKVYAAVSNAQGEAFFLVPFKQVYMVDFPYQKNADAVNLLYMSGVTNGHMNVTYSPDPRLEYPESFIPTPDRLILKSFMDFLQKQYIKPVDKPFNLEIKSVKRINRQSREALFMLTLASSENYGGVRLPLNVAFVLDKSGSMFDDDRSESLKRSLLDIGRTLTQKDIVSVVLFDHEAWPVQRSSENHMLELQMIADNYNPGGGTNIYAGLESGTELLKKTFDKDKSNKIILLTDGYGINPPKEITDFVENKFSEGIEFSAIGLGNDFNQELLELIALKGNGTFSYVDQSSELSETFLKEVKGSFAYVAKDLSIEVYHHNSLIFSTLYGYPVKGKTAGKVSFEIGKLPHGVDRLAFLKFKLEKPSSEIESHPLVVKVKYYDLSKNEYVTYEQKVSLDWTDETDTELLMAQEEQELYGIAILHQSMKVMAEAYAANDLKAARKALKEGKDQIAEIFPDAKPKEVKALFEEVDRYLQLILQIEKNNQ